MDTSDSEYFESADEEFDLEDVRNKNILQRVQNPYLPKNVNTVQSDQNKNKKESIDSKITNEKIEELAIEKHVEINEPGITVPESGTKDILDLEITSNKDVFLCDSNEGIKESVVDDDIDNLWNDGEGWGVDDENEKEGNALNIQKEVVSNKVVSEEHENTNERGKQKPKVKSVEEKSLWDTEEWVTWDSVNEENINKHKSDIASNNQNVKNLWKGWGNWGVNSILSTATQRVSTLTNSVSQGLSTVLETSIGAPDPEKLAMLNHTEGELSEPTKAPSNTNDECENKNVLGFRLSNIGSLVSGVSKLVESTGSKVISGGLDTLETIGKKTMEVIQDGDPGLKRKRAFLNLEGEKPVLSHVLREAKEKAEQENKILQEKHIMKKINYESIFDDHQGLVHLEALEMLSKQCDMKLQSLIESNSGSALVEIQETLDQVKELCELPDEEEDEQISFEEVKERLKSAVEEIGINISYDKLINMWEETECWLSNINLSICDENETHQQAVETLAQLTAVAVEQFHRAGELLLIKDHHSTADEADSLVQLTTTLTSLIGIVAAKFSDKMNSKVTDISNKENINSLITNIFFEASNSSSYIQDAFQLLVPVLQIGAM